MPKSSAFKVLVRHFFSRFFDNESLSPQAEAEANVGQTLALLALPTAFFVLVFRPLDLVRWELLGLRYLFLSYSMIVIGFVMVLKWGSLFPDKRDYQILMPLPLSLPALFLAKVSALVIFLSVFLVDVNFFSILFWPSIDARGNTIVTMAIHTVGVISAGVFAALAAAAIQGVLITIFSGNLLRRIGVLIQTLLMALLVMMFVLTPLIGFSTKELVKADHPLLYNLPSFWFAGLYEQMRPATGNPIILSLGKRAVWGLVISAAVFGLTYLPLYRRHTRRVLEAPEPSASGPGQVAAMLNAVLNRLILRHPVDRGVFHFITQTITRSMKHRLFLATYGGFGLAMAVLTFGSGPEGLLQLPLILSFVLVSGLRAAFNFPSELAANWTFQVSEQGDLAGYLRATRRWITICAIVPLFLLFLPFELHYFTWPEAAFHCGFGITITVLLMEVMFLGFTKVPFTCSYFPGKVNLTGLAVIYVFGFTAYSRVFAGLESLLAGMPVAAACFFAAVAACVWGLSKWRTYELRESPVLTFEDEGDPAVRTLNLAS